MQILSWGVNDCIAFLGASVEQTQQLWEDVEKQKRLGGYPWTHLSHDQEKEIWLDPLKLPPNITRYCIH